MPRRLLYYHTLREALGCTRVLAARIPLARMTPHEELATTSYCLADPGKAYVVYLPAGGEVTVDLSAAPGSLAVEWMRPSDGTIQFVEAVSGGTRRLLKAPFAGDAVLYLQKK